MPRLSPSRTRSPVTSGGRPFPMSRGPAAVAVDGHLLIVTGGVGSDEDRAAITTIHDPVEELPLVDDVRISDQKIVRSDRCRTISSAQSRLSVDPVVLVSNGLTTTVAPSMVVARATSSDRTTTISATPEERSSAM